MWQIEAGKAQATAKNEKLVFLYPIFTILSIGLLVAFVLSGCSKNPPAKRAADADVELLYLYDASVGAFQRSGQVSDLLHGSGSGH